VKTCRPSLAKSSNAAKVLLLAATLALFVGATTQAAQFPGAGWDSFSSTGLFHVVLSPAYGGATYTIRVTDPNTIILRSAAHWEDDPTDVGGAVVGNGNSPQPPVVTDPDNVSDSDIGPHPATFEQGSGTCREVHTKMAWLNMQNGDGWAIRAGDAALSAPRSLGEVEALSHSGNPNDDFPARSFFNLYVEVDLPAGLGGMTLVNVMPIVVQVDTIYTFPPLGRTYVHTFNFANGNATALYDVTGCNLVGWLMRASHGVAAPNPPGDTSRLPHIPLQLPYPTVFSVDGEPNPAEGLIDSCWPFPNDVFSLGTAGGWGGARPGVVPLSTTKGELFQASGALLGAAPDITNTLRISGALGTGEPGPPPYMGPITPPPGPPGPPAILRMPGPFDMPWAVGTMGMQEGDNLVAVSFGADGGNLPLFSVNPAAIGVPGSGVYNEAVLAPVFGRPPTIVPSNVGGSPGEEAAGDIFIGPPNALSFGLGLGPWTAPAPPGSNVLGTDELLLGLQAPDTLGSAHTLTNEDDLDALELSNGNHVDWDYDGIPDEFIYFSIDGTSPTIGIADPFLDVLTPNDGVFWGGVAFRPGPPDPDGVTPDDILIARPGGFMFGIYASGVQDIGLMPGDEIDAVALCDFHQYGYLNPIYDTALFSLRAGSPSLTGANPNMPVGPLSPGDIYMTNFNGTVTFFAWATSLGLTLTDELNALDVIGVCEDSDEDGWCESCPGWPIQGDNCPGVYNPNQADTDWDGVGDACVIPTAGWDPSWIAIGYPEYTKHGTQFDKPLSIGNCGNIATEFEIVLNEDAGPHSGWLSVSASLESGIISPGAGNEVSGTVTINAGGSINLPGTVVHLTGDLTATGNFDDSPFIFPIDFFVVDTIVVPVFDTISTGCFSLVVSNMGNWGNQGAGRVNLDFWDYGDCEGQKGVGDNVPGDASIYVYDASPVICWPDGDSVLCNWSIFGTTYISSEGFVPLGHTPVTPFVYGVDCDENPLSYANAYLSQFATHDTGILIEKWWIAPDQSAHQGSNWIIQVLRISVIDGQTHSGLNIGEAIDWDIPSDSAARNLSGFSVGQRLIYQQGSEYNQDPEECQENSDRFGGIELLSIREDFGGTVVVTSSPYGAYTGSNSRWVNPTGGFIAHELDSLMTARPGYVLSDSINADLHSVMTFKSGYTLTPTTTIWIFKCLITSRLGFAAFIASAQECHTWYEENLTSPNCGCCIPPIRGNVDYDGGDVIDISDLVYLVDFMFTGGPAPPCFEEADMNGDGAIDISDLVWSVDFMFSGGPPPVACP